MTYAADLVTIRDQIVARIIEVTAAPKPSYNIDGQAVSWTQYLAELRKQLRETNDMIKESDGPFEFHTQAFT